MKKTKGSWTGKIIKMTVDAVAIGILFYVFVYYL